MTTAAPSTALRSAGHSRLPPLPRALGSGRALAGLGSDRFRCGQGRVAVDADQLYSVDARDGTRCSYYASSVCKQTIDSVFNPTKGQQNVILFHGLGAGLDRDRVLLFLARGN